MEVTVTEDRLESSLEFRAERGVMSRGGSRGGDL